MSVAAAMAFFELARRDPVLRARLAALRDEGATDAALRALASEADLACDMADLAEAFRIDWVARWAHFSARIRTEGT
jgi:hypothetical protein